MDRRIDYNNLMHTAMRRLIRDVLADVERNGRLPGTHHFFITFDTSHPDAELADWLSDRYPSEMTVVMQHWYDNLDVGEDGFAVTLNFGNAAEPLYIPYAAIKTFVDPSVEFGLRFETQDDHDPQTVEKSNLQRIMRPTRFVTEKGAKDGKSEKGEKADTRQNGQDADIVSLDTFRKQ